MLCEEGGGCQPGGIGKAGSEIPFLEYKYGANLFLCWFSRLPGCALFNRDRDFKMHRVQRPFCSQPAL